ncbi:MAG: hypothetical protein JSV77_04485 [Dehalococcoidales bacterium]|nr:MAG: hypothetical protein JSV77_04485 [Dehalococcoidales bacterium]
MGRFLKWMGITLGVLIIIIVLVGGYFGLVPGVSNLFGSHKPKDLGITYTEADRLSGRAKAGWEVIDLPSDLPPEESFSYSGQNAVDATFSNAELTAWANDPWTYFPLSDCQLRVNDDNTVEFSGKLNIGVLRDWIDAMGVADEYSELIDDYLRWFIWGNPPVYVKLSVNVVNGQILNPQIHEAKVGRISIPDSLIQDNLYRLVDYAEWQMNHIPGFSVESLEFVDGGVRFVGTMPAVVSRSVE